MLNFRLPRPPALALRERLDYGRRTGAALADVWALRGLPLHRELRTLVPGAVPDGTPPAPEGAPGVLLVPGFGCTDASLRRVSRTLDRLGWTTHPARLPVNLDCSQAMADLLAGRLEALAAEHGPLLVAGHSRGGLLARAVAQRCPEDVAGLLTIASPVARPYAAHPAVVAAFLALGAAGSAGVPGVGRLTCRLGACCAPFRAACAAPLEGTPHVSLHTPHDGIVDPAACIAPGADNREVDTTHIGTVVTAAGLGAAALALHDLARLHGAGAAGR